MSDKPLLNQIQETFEDPASLLVTFLLDSSGSVGTKGYEELRSTTIHLTNQLKGVMTQVIQFSTTAIVVCPFTVEQSFVLEALRSMKHLNGSTNMAAGFELAHQTLKYTIRPDSRPIVFFITDGQPTTDPTEEIKKFMSFVKIILNLVFFKQ